MSIYFIQLIYLIIIYIAFFKNGYTKKAVKLYIITSFPILLLVMGLRSVNVGVDTKLYYNLFLRYSKMSFHTLLKTGGGDGSSDYLYLIYNKFLSFISTDAAILTFFNSLIICLLAYYFIYKNSEKYTPFSIILFIIMCHYIYYFNANRQGMAILIAANSLTFITEKNLKKFLITIAIAMLVHTSAIIYIIFIPLFFMKFTRKNIILYLIIITFVFTSWTALFPIFAKMNTHYSLYIDDKVATEVGGMRKLVYTFFYLFMGIILLVKAHDFEKNRRYTILLIMNYILVLTGFLYIKNWIIVRIEDLFVIYDIILIPEFIKIFRNKNVIMCCSIIIFTIGMYIRLSSGYAGAVPYETFLYYRSLI